MKNKFLITVIIPSVEMELEIYIPNNKMVGTVKKYILNSIIEVTNGNFNKSLSDTKFIDSITGNEYKNNVLVNDSSLKNGTRLIVL